MIEHFFVLLAPVLDSELFVWMFQVEYPRYGGQTTRRADRLIFQLLLAGRELLLNHLKEARLFLHHWMSKARQTSHHLFYQANLFSFSPPSCRVSYLSNGSLVSASNVTRVSGAVRELARNSDET